MTVSSLAVYYLFYLDLLNDCFIYTVNNVLHIIVCDIRTCWETEANLEEGF